MEKSDIEFLFSSSPIPYTEAIDFMNQRSLEIAAGTSRETIWFLEHPLTFTAGISASETEIKNLSISVVKTNRGGKHTLHAPGQRVVYLILNLKKRAQNKVPDVKAYVFDLEQIIINSLFKMGLTCQRKAGNIGVWVNNPLTGWEEKIAAIGVRFSKGITTHGFAINVSNSLSDFSNIIPCGISEFNVCSFESLGKCISLKELDENLIREISIKFPLVP